jgi:phenylpyruvate tautomerase PptA (4-oxalocrotonate tautomerase family)
MPYLKIETNERLDEATAQELLKKASALTAELLGKPEKWIMVTIYQGKPMIFDGNTQPAAFVELKSIGLSQDICAGLSRALCNFLKAELGIEPERVYIEFWDINKKMFGWNGGTF